MTDFNLTGKVFVLDTQNPPCLQVRRSLQVEASRASSPTTAAVCSSASPGLPAELRSEDGTEALINNVF